MASVEAKAESSGCTSGPPAATNLANSTSAADATPAKVEEKHWKMGNLNYDADPVIKTATIYGSSSQVIDPIYAKVAFDLGKALAENGTCVRCVRCGRDWTEMSAAMPLWGLTLSRTGISAAIPVPLLTLSHYAHRMWCPKDQTKRFILAQVIVMSSTLRPRKIFVNRSILQGS